MRDEGVNPNFRTSGVSGNSLFELLLGVDSSDGLAKLLPLDLRVVFLCCSRLAALVNISAAEIGESINLSASSYIHSDTLPEPLDRLDILAADYFALDPTNGFSTEDGRAAADAVRSATSYKVSHQYMVLVPLIYTFCTWPTLAQVCCLDAILNLWESCLLGKVL